MITSDFWVISGNGKLKFELNLRSLEMKGWEGLHVNTCDDDEDRESSYAQMNGRPVNPAAIDGREVRDTPLFPLEPLERDGRKAAVKPCEPPGSYHRGVKVCSQPVHNFTPV